MHMALFIYILLHSDWLFASRVTLSLATAAVSVATAAVSMATAAVSLVMGQRSVKGQIYVMFCEQSVNMPLPTSHGLL